MDFGWFLKDFGSPFGHHFGSLFEIFCHLDRQKVCLDCRYDFYRLLNGKPADFWCPHLSIYMVNTDVFIRYHFFDFFVNLMILGTNLDLILDTSGGLGRPVWWFLGVLEIPWNFIDFQDHPKLRLRTWWVVKWSSRASSNRSISPACWPPDCQTPAWRPVDHQIVIADGMLEEYLKYDISMKERITLTSDLTPLSSQPDGPWQAGAGGYYGYWIFHISS